METSLKQIVNAKQVVVEFLTAVQNGNFEKVGALLHPEVTWSQPGTNQFSGQKTSGAEVYKMVGGMFQVSENSLRLTQIKSIAENGNRVACLLNWYGTKPSGAILDVDNIDVYTVVEGKITATQVFSVNCDQEDDFWGN